MPCNALVLLLCISPLSFPVHDVDPNPLPTPATPLIVRYLILTPHPTVSAASHSSHLAHSTRQPPPLIPYSPLGATCIAWLKFQRNRFARVYPLYLFCTLGALPFWLAGYGSCNPYDTGCLVASIGTSVIPLTTTFILRLGAPLDGE